MPTNTDKLTAIRIKQQNGSYGPQIPVSADAVNVKYDNLYSVKEVLGNVKTNIGPLQEQIDNIDTSSISEAVTDWLEDNPGALLPTDKTLSVADVPADAQQAGKVVTVNGETAGNATKVHFNTTNQIISVLTTDDIDNTLSQTGAVADAKVIGDKVADLDSAINNSDTVAFSVPISISGITNASNWTLNSSIYATTGANLSADGYARSGYNSFTQSILFVMNSASFTICAWAYSAASVSNALYTSYKDYNHSEILLPHKETATHFRIGVKKLDGTAMTSVDLEAALANLKTYVYTDKILAISNVPADAKTTGDALATLENADTLLQDAINLENAIGETTIQFSAEDYVLGRRVISNNNIWSTASVSTTTYGTLISIPTGCNRIEVMAEAMNGSIIAFLASNRGYNDGTGGRPDFSVNYQNRIELDAGVSVTYNCYEDVKYLYMLTTDSSGNAKTPTVIYHIDAKESVNFIFNNKTLVLSDGIVSSKGIDDSGNWVSFTGSFTGTCIYIPYGTGRVKVSYKDGSIIAFLKNTTNRASGGAASFADGYTGRIVFEGTGNAEYEVGTDCHWIYANITTRLGNDVAPTIMCTPDIARATDLSNPDEVAENKMFAILPTVYSGWFDWRLYRGYRDDGTTMSSEEYATTDPITVVPGNQLVNLCPSLDDDNIELFFFVVEFNDETFVRRISIDSGAKYVVPNGVNRIRLMFGHSISTDIKISKSIISQYFAIQFLSSVRQNDFESPVYAAYGASTTIGAVHHLTGTSLSGTSLSMSPWAFPDYLARALNLQNYNRGIGSTGFLARGSGGTSKNILDSIYTDDELLSRASLVTITFGYGNDRGAGLPIGLFDDYYPYDAEGYHPAGSEGITQMKTLGITLMGALNWCIKWISEKYPTVTLVIVFGSPSANSKREVKIKTNTSGTLPPKKLTIEEPYVDSDPQPYSVPSNDQKGIAQIKTQLDILKAKMNIPVIDMFFDGININYYNSYAKDSSGQYAIFSTTGDPADQETWEWNLHPNDAGYKMYSEFVAGKIISLFKH